MRAGPANCIAKWDGSGWSALGSGMGGAVYALAVSGTTLSAGGDFTMAGGLPADYIAKWDGSAWSRLSVGMNYDVYALAVSGTSLYAGGGFSQMGGGPANCIAKLDGSTWSTLGEWVSGDYYYGRVLALAVSGTILYVGGEFTSEDLVPAKYIAKWDGSAWSALGSGMDNWVFALAVNGTNLYAGGAFTTAGGVVANNIAKWDGSAWSALGSGMNGNVYALAADGPAHLFVGGTFSLAGTNASLNIAQANLPSFPTIFMVSQTQTVEMGTTVDLAVDAAGGDLTYDLVFNGTNILSGGSDSCLELTHLSFAQAGAYAVVVSNFLGTATSAPVTLNVIAPVARRLVPGVNLTAQPGNLLALVYRDDLGPATNWETMATMTLSNASQFYFDVSQPLPPQRFYRAWQTGTPAVVPSLDLHMVPAITVTGNVGDSLRLDCINQFGPTGAWVALATVTLTNTSQLYFDTSSIGQPARLWRIVPVP